MIPSLDDVRIHSNNDTAQLEEATRPATRQPEEAGRTQQPKDLQPIQATYMLDGKNYLKWSLLVHTVLKGK